MSVRTKKLRDLDQNVREFFMNEANNGGLVLEDDAGQVRFSVIPYIVPTPEERAKAWRTLEAIQQEVGRNMQAQGITEEDIDRVLQED